MVTGSRAFQGRSSGETLAAILRDDPPDPLASGKVFPPDLARIIAHCLARGPAQRFQSAQDLAFNLKAVLAGSAVSIPGPPRRQPRRFWMALAAFVVVATLVGVLLATRRETTVARDGGVGAVISSLAVLPMENLSHDPEQEYFADGMTEELNTQLAQIAALKVISRTSSNLQPAERQPRPAADGGHRHDFRAAVAHLAPRIVRIGLSARF